jgi:hypothetical protein
MNQSDKDKALIDAAEKAAFEQNNKDYWDAHIQFGSDPELRCAWFHGVGFDAGRAFERDRARELNEALDTLLGSISAPVFQDSRLDYVEVQVDPRDIQHAREVLKRFGEVSECSEI